ncbi:MAG: SPFH/Band 7/PHB domain protein [candidate division Zixibacteria bacterium]|nr:SPFH/Band 7/PHB domain protein [candidate division Zixibacteria bacterium]
MEAFLIVVLLIALLVIAIIAKGLLIVKQAEVVVIERLGRFDRLLHSGVNIIWPFLEKPRPVVWRYTYVDLDRTKKILEKSVNRIDLRESVYDFPQQSVITRDNVSIEIDALLYFQVTDPKQAVYEIDNLPNAIEKLTQTTLRNVVGELDLDETLTSRDTINSKLKAILDEATDKWGVKINRVELQDIAPPEDIKTAMEKQMRAERDKRAAILVAEGEKRAKVLNAEGERDARIAEAEGVKRFQVLEAEGEAQARINVASAEAEALRLIVDAIREKGDPVNYLVAVRYLETLKTLGDSPNEKIVFLPFEATGVLSSLGGIKEMLKSVETGK